MLFTAGLIQSQSGEERAGGAEGAPREQHGEMNGERRGRAAAPGWYFRGGMELIQAPPTSLSLSLSLSVCVFVCVCV